MLNIACSKVKSLFCVFKWTTLVWWNGRKEEWRQNVQSTVTSHVIHLECYHEIAKVEVHSVSCKACFVSQASGRHYCHQLCSLPSLFNPQMVKRSSWYQRLKGTNQNATCQEPLNCDVFLPINMKLSFFVVCLFIDFLMTCTILFGNTCQSVSYQQVWKW